MTVSFLIPLIAVLVFLVILMAVIWHVSVRMKNAGIVDVAWSFSFAPATVILALFSEGWIPRKLAVCGIVALWSLRLTWHLLERFRAHHPVEDGRYAKLRKQWGDAADRRMFVFFQIQGLIVLILCLPFILAMRWTDPGFHWLEGVGILVVLAGVWGESISDSQLNRFKAGAGNRGKVCNEGLWRYSRHPNYFFECLNWVGFALLGAAAPWGWIGFLAPALIIYLLLKVTGIPATEAQALRTKGPEYAAYQARTSVLVPWFPKKV